MGKCPENDSALEREIPVFQVLDVASDAILDVRTISCFTTKSSHLSQTGDSRLNERADVIIGHQLGKLLVMFDQMRPWTDDAHVAPEDVPELRDFVDT